MSNIEGTKYYFAVTENPSTPGKIDVSLRSNYKAINEIAEEFGGGGHDKSCGLSLKVESTEKFIQELIDKLTTLHNY